MQINCLEGNDRRWDGMKINEMNNITPFIDLKGRVGICRLKANYIVSVPRPLAGIVETNIILNKDGRTVLI